MAEKIKLVEKIELWAIEDLKPYDKNPKTHPPEQIEKIKQSIISFGFNDPIGVHKKFGIVAGHGRLAAARELDMQQVPVVVLEHLTVHQAKAFLIADNKANEGAPWDYKLLAEVMKELAAAEVDLGNTGFDEKEIANLLQGMNVQFDQDTGASESGNMRNPAKRFIIGVNNFLIICTDDKENETVKAFCDFMEENPTLKIEVDKKIKDGVLKTIHEILPS